MDKTGRVGVALVVLDLHRAVAVLDEHVGAVHASPEPLLHAVSAE